MNEPTEPYAIADVFSTDLTVEDLGSGMRGLVFSSPHISRTGESYQRNEVRIVVPAACLLSIRQKLAPHADQVLYELITPSGNHNNTPQ